MKTVNNISKFSSDYYINLEKNELNWDWNFSKKRVYTKFIFVNILLIVSTGIFMYLQ